MIIDVQQFVLVDNKKIWWNVKSHIKYALFTW